MPARDTHRLFESGLPFLKPAETEERDAFEAMKLRLPLAVARLLRSTQPVFRRGKSRRHARPAVSGRRPTWPSRSIATASRRCLPGKPLAQTGDSLLERSLRRQGGTAQELWFQHEAKPLLGGESFGGLEPLQRQFRFAAIEVKHRPVLQGACETERVGAPFGQCQSFAAKRQPLLGIPEQPMGLRTQVARARARVVPAIELMLEAVPLGIIEPAPLLAVIARRRRLAGEQTSRPSAMVRLQT